MDFKTKARGYLASTNLDIDFFVALAAGTPQGIAS